MLFQLGEFTLHAGQASRFKIECDALTDGDYHALAHLITELMPAFARVEGVPRGGLPLAAALQPYVVDDDGPILLVDDVFTTGTSMERAYRNIRLHEDTPIMGAVAFARTPPPPWITPIFTLNPDLGGG